jgi:hypothetical protein
LLCCLLLPNTIKGNVLRRLNGQEVNKVTKQAVALRFCLLRSNIPAL